MKRSCNCRLAKFLPHLILVAASLSLQAAEKPATRSTTPVFPGPSWETRTPESVGLVSGPLDEFARRVGGDGCIVKDGFLVKTWGKFTQHEDWASAAKPVLSTLLLAAVADGQLPSVDALVKDRGWLLSTKDSAMTFRHLANMVSGYACLEPPGQAWGYNDHAIQLYGKSLERVFGRSLDEAFRQRFAALQFEDGAFFGSRNRLGVVASPRDFARLGWLWLNHGRWGKSEVLPTTLYNACIRPQVPADLPRTRGKSEDYLKIGTYGGGTDQTPYGPGACGFNFWFNEKIGGTGERVWPALPADAYQANGMWNRDTVTVIPSQHMVIAVRGAKLGAFEPGKPDGIANQNFQLLVNALEVKSQAKLTSPAGRPVPFPEATNNKLVRPFLLPICQSVAPGTPYPPSPVIAAMEWAPANHITRVAHDGDNWPVTWADDDALFTTWGDGTGFHPKVETKLSLGFARVTGMPDAFKGINVRSPAEQLGQGRAGKKGWGLLCVEGVLYLWLGHADNRGAMAQLAWSRDHAKTWTFADWRFTEFGLMGFVNFGKNYAGARDDYVYAFC